MTVLQAFVHRLVGDEQFRRKVLANPVGVVRQLGLAPDEERSVLRLCDRIRVAPVAAIGPTSYWA